MISPSYANIRDAYTQVTTTAVERGWMNDEWPFIMPPHRIKTYWREPGRMAMVARHVAAFMAGGGESAEEGRRA